MLKSYRVGWVVVVAHKILLSAPGMGIVELWTRGFGLGLDNRREDLWLK